MAIQADSCLPERLPGFSTKMPTTKISGQALQAAPDLRLALTPRGGVTVGRADRIRIQKPSWEPNGGGEAVPSEPPGPNGSSKSSPSRHHLGEGAEIKGHTVSSCGGSLPGDKQVGNSLHRACVGRIRRSCHYYQASDAVPSTELSASQHPRCYRAPKFSKRVPTWENPHQRGGRGLLEMQVWGPHLLNRKLEDRPRIGATV